MRHNSSNFRIVRLDNTQASANPSADSCAEASASLLVRFLIVSRLDGCPSGLRHPEHRSVQRPILVSQQLVGRQLVAVPASRRPGFQSLAGTRPTVSRVPVASA